MKRIIALAITAVLTVSLLGACGNQKGEENPKADATVNQLQPSEPESNTEPSETKPEEQGVTAQRISKITWTMRDDGETYSIVDEFEYDDDNAIIHWMQSANDQLYHDYQYAQSIERPILMWGIAEQSQAYSYDAEGNLISRILDNGSISEIYVYEDGQCVENLWYVYEELERRAKLNENGDPLELLIYSDGEVSEKILWTYDENENPLTREHHADGEVSSNTIYQYDKNGHLLEMVDYENGEISGKTVFGYDENGNRIKELQYAAEPGDTFGAHYDPDYEMYLLRSNTWEYDKDGNLIAESCDYDEDDECIHSDRYEYISGNLLNRELHYDRIGDLIAEVNYEYDSSGNLLKKSFCNDEEEYLRFTYTYDAKGFLAGIEIMEDGHRIATAEIHFDCVVVSEEQAAELGKVLVAWKSKNLFSYEFEWER